MAEQTLEISTRDVNGVAVVTLLGWVNTDTARELQAALKALVAKGTTKIVLDLDGVVHISSAGLRVMVITRGSLQQSNGDLRLCNLPDRVREVLRLAGLTSTFGIYNDQPSAISSFETDS